jgi:serine/threonine protein kinase
MSDEILNKIGGKIIASGGFGCVFEPALKCDKNEKKEEEEEKEEKEEKGTRNISKLMINKYAIAEFEDTKKYKKLLETIPNYRNYFLVDGYSICRPAPLTKKDLKGFKTKCNPLHKKNITRKRINKHLDEVKIINSPYGGEDLGDYIQKNETPKQFAKINDAMIALLENGILPMNKRGVYHLDIKESNILIDVLPDQEPLLRLIDWGLSCTYKKDDEIPYALMRRSFQYNAPMSIIILHHKFSDKYEDFLIDIPSPDYDVIQEFVSEYVLDWFEQRGIGHFKIVHEILEELFKRRSDFITKTKTSSSIDYLMDTEIDYSNKTEKQKYIVTYNIIINYITDILVEYTSEGRSNANQYFTDVFIKNVDIWGFIMAYSPILEYYCNNYSELSKQERKVYAKLCDIFVNYLYASPLSVIDANSLKKDLQEFSRLLREVSSHKERSSSARNKSAFTDSAVLKDSNETKIMNKKIISAIAEASSNK